MCGSNIHFGFLACLSLCLAGCVWLPGCMSDSSMGAQPIAGSSNTTALAGAVASEVNRYRQQQGAKPLPRHRGLDNLAQGHANYLIKNRGSFSLHGRTVSHYGFDGRSLIARERLGFDSISENVASTTSGVQGAPQVLCRTWANSASHNQNMKASWTHTGVAVVTADDGLVVAVQLFGTMGMRSHNEMMDKMRGF